MDTPTSVILSQVPLGIACFLAVYELHRIRNEIEKITNSMEAKR